MPSIDIHQHFWPEPFIAVLRARDNPPHLQGDVLVLLEGRFAIDLRQDLFDIIEKRAARAGQADAARQAFK